MNRKIIGLLAVLCALCLLLTGCGNDSAKPAVTDAPAATAAPTAEPTATAEPVVTAAPQDEGEPFAEVTDDKDFSALRTAGSQEDAYEYMNFYRPAKDGIKQPYVGDTMPYYENGTYYIYYLKEASDSYNHSIYLANTTDFTPYTEFDAHIL